MLLQNILLVAAHICMAQEAHFVLDLIIVVLKCFRFVKQVNFLVNDTRKDHLFF